MYFFYYLVFTHRIFIAAVTVDVSLIEMLGIDGRMEQQLKVC